MSARSRRPSPAPEPDLAPMERLFDTLSERSKDALGAARAVGGDGVATRQILGEGMARLGRPE